MKLAQAKEFLPLIQAAAEGKTIQYRGDKSKYPEYGPDDWTDMDQNNCAFGSSLSLEYRIKPEPQLRPWKPEEVPAGALIKLQYGGWPSVICDVSGDAISHIWDGEVKIRSFNEILKHCVHSTDGGKTWKPCGVEVVQCSVSNSLSDK